MQSLSSILSDMKLDAGDRQKGGKISILKRPETSEPVSTGETALSQSAVVEPLADKPATAQTPSTSATPVSSSTTTPASSSTNTPASAATASCVAAVIEEVESDQNRRRRKILQEEMNWRKKVELLGDYSDNRDWGLMEAEWLRSIPEDFEKKWIVVPCPVGKRCSIWALDGETHAYTKQGVFLESFESPLPNGFHYSRSEGSTFLDGIFCENLATYFILDALQWEDYDLRRGSAEFRLYHLNTKMTEYQSGEDVPPPRVRARLKHFVMQLPLFPCTAQGVAKALSWSPLPNLRLELDGILFFHHDAMYKSGTTPLVAWIKPWMAEEVFSNVRVPPHLMAKRPYHYKDRQTFMKEWDDKQARKRVKGSEKVGRKPFLPRSTPSNPSKNAAAAAANDDDDDDDADVVAADRGLPPLNDDPALAAVAKAAEKCDNSLLALVGENILDTFGVAGSGPAGVATATAADGVAEGAAAAPTAASPRPEAIAKEVS